MKPFLLFVILFFHTISIFSLEPAKTDSVYWPMEYRLPISGSFSEFRNGHLHMGCDFKTYGINGFPIVSVFDGTIHSMSYSNVGYGLSINLYSPALQIYAKYAHLNDLSGNVTGLDELKTALLLLGNKDGFNVKLKPEYFKLKNGDRIARSGETGSGVSHLHLELFDGKEFFNPLSFINFKQEDKIFPVIQSVHIESDKGYGKVFPAVKISDNVYSFNSEEAIKINGRVKFKIAGFDNISSRNKNGLYGIKLIIEGKTFFEKTFDRMTYKEAAEKDNIYDLNKSSLSPPVYVYNLFENKNSYSIDLNNEEAGKVIQVEMKLIDASNNVSTVKFPITVSSDSSFKKTAVNSKFSSEDKKVSLDFSRIPTYGEGGISIKKVDKFPENILMENLNLVGDAYEVEAINFSWKGAASGSFTGSFSGREEGLYLYDMGFKQWVPIGGKKNGSSISFSLGKIGILAVLQDKIPPNVSYPYLIYRYYNLPEIQDSNMIERFYYASDRGAGVSSRIELLLEGASYPYTFDRDRNFIKIEIPKSLKNIKSNLFIQIRVQDNAGNYSKWFTDLVNL